MNARDGRGGRIVSRDNWTGPFPALALFWAISFGPESDSKKVEKSA